MSARQILKVSSFKTASRCWMPATQQPTAARFFSSKQRYINFNMHSLSDSHLISNDDVIIEAHSNARPQEIHEEPFEPIVYSSEEVHTAGPVREVQN